MKQTKSISSIFGRASLLVAFLAAFVFSASNGLRPVFTADVDIRQHQHIDDEQQDDERPVAYIDYAFNAVVPVAQISFLHQPSFEAPLPPVADTEIKPLIQLPRLVNNYFRTLFRLIISPNAP